MLCNMLHQRDLNMLFDDVYTVAPLQEMGQLVYLSYGWIVLGLYIQQTHGESHQKNLSTSTLTIFETDFSKQNRFTTTFRTKSHKTKKFSMLFRRKVAPLPKSTYMVQYLFDSMFVCYILQKQRGVAQKLLFG